MRLIVRSVLGLVLVVAGGCGGALGDGDGVAGGDAARTGAAAAGGGVSMAGLPTCATVVAPRHGRITVEDDAQTGLSVVRIDGQAVCADTPAGIASSGILDGSLVVTPDSRLPVLDESKVHLVPRTGSDPMPAKRIRTAGSDPMPAGPMKDGDSDSDGESEHETRRSPRDADPSELIDG